ncbi:MAG: hypothetical protein ACTHU0_18570 [Kofleriaceae bacterium]
MLISLLLAVLACFDVLLAGFRAAAGREGRLAKAAYFREAIARSAWFALAIVCANAVLAAGLVATAPDPGASWAAFVDAGTAAVCVLGAFATLTLAALLWWFSPSVEHRLLASILVLGPFTLARPLVIVGGLVAGSLATDEPRVWIVAATAGISMLAVERVLARRYADRWRRLVE